MKKKATKLSLDSNLLGHVVSVEERIDAIFTEAVNLYGYSVEELCSASRTYRLTEARHWTMAMLRKHTSLTLTEIANRLGRSDHTTARHACHKYGLR